MEGFYAADLLNCLSKAEKIRNKLPRPLKKTEWAVEEIGE